MALPEIHFDIDQLMNDVITMNTAKMREIDTAMQSACDTVATLTVMGWEGESKDAFLTQFTKFKKKMRLFYENLHEFNNCLKKIHAEGEDVYQQGGTLLNRL